MTALPEAQDFRAAAVDRARRLDQPAFIRVVDTPRGGPGSVDDTGAGGVLAGVPVAVKDNIDVVGLPTTAGYSALDREVVHSATAVARLQQAGAFVVGKTNLDQFATGLVGTRSPYGACWAVDSPAHVSGGSSSGSAVAVAAGVVPLALGTDTAGSGRVPAAFNGLVGIKPTRGLVPTTGVFPACRSLDCVTTLTRTVGLGRLALDVMSGYDPADPRSRAAPVVLPPGVARRMTVVGVPAGPIDLDPPSAVAWASALEHAATVATLVPVDVEPFLAAARLLYGGPWVAERYAAFGDVVERGGSGLDPTVAQIVRAGGSLDAASVFRGLDELARLESLTRTVWESVDALLLPVTPLHPTLAQVAADPVGVNSRLGTFTNMTNLLDLCAVAVPAGRRDDGLPFGVQLMAPAFADQPLLDLAARWCGEVPPALVEGAPDRTRGLLAVAGAHLHGQPANDQLVGLGGRLERRATTAAGYRMLALPGMPPRPALVRDGPADVSAVVPGLPVEVWSLPLQAVGQLLPSIDPRLGFARIELADGTAAPGFVLADPASAGAPDITAYGGWRSYLTAQRL